MGQVGLIWMYVVVIPSSYLQCNAMPIQFCTEPLQTNFKEGNGKVYMTRATKAIYNFLMLDFVKIRCACVLGPGDYKSSNRPG